MLQIKQQRISLEPISKRGEHSKQQTLAKKISCHRSMSVNSQFRNRKIQGTSLALKNQRKQLMQNQNSGVKISQQCRINLLHQALKARKITKNTVENEETDRKQGVKSAKQTQKHSFIPVSTASRKSVYSKVSKVEYQRIPARRKTNNLNGLSQQALYLRKESHLNAYFNVRKNRLKDITKQNKKIYVRINSQKSLYSSRELNKSYESNCSLSRGLSQSKLSKFSRSSSKKSISSSRAKQSGRFTKQKQQKSIIVESKDINHLSGDQMKKFVTIFANKINAKIGQPRRMDCTSQRFQKQNSISMKSQKPQKCERTLQKIVEQFSAGGCKINVLKANNRLL